MSLPLVPDGGKTLGITIFCKGCDIYGRAMQYRFLSPIIKTVELIPGRYCMEKAISYSSYRVVRETQNFILKLPYTQNYRVTASGIILTF